MSITRRSSPEKSRSLYEWFRRWNLRRILRRHPIPHDVWHDVTGRIPALRELDAAQRVHLRELATWFLYRKSISGAQGLEVTMEMRIAVAAQACLLILNLDTDHFDDWVEVILYPGAFRVQHEHMDEIGLLHDEVDDLTGESWLRGPVILSWEDVAQDSYHPEPGRNVVVHEFAHKLDGLNGSMNGMPSLPDGMNRQAWAAELGAAYAALCHQVEAGHQTLIDEYAATSPAEFFAVCSEYFFTAPDVLQHCCPGVHHQLGLFYGRTT